MNKANIRPTLLVPGCRARKKECEQLASRLQDPSHQVLGSDGILPCIIEMCFTGLSHLTCYIDGRPSQLVCFKKKRLLLSVASRVGFEPALQD